MADKNWSSLREHAGLSYLNITRNVQSVEISTIEEEKIDFNEESTFTTLEYEGRNEEKIQEKG